VESGRDGDKLQASACRPQCSRSRVPRDTSSRTSNALDRVMIFGNRQRHTDYIVALPNHDAGSIPGPTGHVSVGVALVL
jgi:hypothetical protein